MTYHYYAGGSVSPEKSEFRTICGIKANFKPTTWVDGALGNEKVNCHRCRNILDKHLQSKPLFTTKHYKAIAEFLRKLKSESTRDYFELVLGEIVDLISKDNSKFSITKFMKLANKS